LLLLPLVAVTLFLLGSWVWSAVNAPASEDTWPAGEEGLPVPDLRASRAGFGPQQMQLTGPAIRFSETSRSLQPAQ
jgi:hypothetical protein